jgi:hypothetical protein
MASKQTWDKYRCPGIIETDEELLSMIRDVVETIHTLERMYGHKEASFTVRALLVDFFSLEGIAHSRGISNYERP